jgi:hypothetical protein
VTLGRRVVGAELDLLGVVVGDLYVGVGDILGDIHQHRAGAAGGGDVEGLADGQGQVVDIPHQEVVLDAGPGDADRVHLLEGVVADQSGGYLAGEDHQRNGIHVSGGDAGDGIGHTGARGDQHHARLAAGAGIAIGGVTGGLFVADQHVLDVVLEVERVINVQDGTARITEQIFDAFFLQAADQDLGASDKFHDIDSSW